METVNRFAHRLVRRDVKRYYTAMPTIDKTAAFRDFIATQSADISLGRFLFNMILAAMLSHLLGMLYVRYADSLSNRKQFARTFMLTTLTTLLVITIVKSSLALSLGMVGALSIVRFRAAIKEPEELTYLFLALGIGLGFGADQRVITIAAVLFIALVVFLRKSRQMTERPQNLYMTVSARKGRKADLEGVAELLQQYCPVVSLRRLEETKDQIEASFFVEFEDFDRLSQARAKLCALDESMKISFLDNTGII